MRDFYCHVLERVIFAIMELLLANGDEELLRRHRHIVSPPPSSIYRTLSHLLSSTINIYLSERTSN